MKEETSQAAAFLTSYLGAVPPNAQDKFRERVAALLLDRCARSWHPAHPYVGNGARALTVSDGIVDPALLACGAAAGLSAAKLAGALPRDLVLWVDPHVVAYRLGDHSPALTIWEDAEALAGLLLPAFFTRDRAREARGDVGPAAASAAPPPPLPLAPAPAPEYGAWVPPASYTASAPRNEDKERRALAFREAIHSSLAQANRAAQPGVVCG